MFVTEVTMPISQALNESSKLGLMASDMAYGGTSIPYGTSLGQYHDTPSYDIPVPYSVPGGFVIPDGGTFQDPTTGFKAVVFWNPSTREVIAGFAGTDGLDPQDWVANTQHLGWNQWQENNNGNQVLDLIDSLSPTNVLFAGGSLGGVHAHYGAYAYIDRHKADTGFDKSSVSLFTFNGLGGLQGLQQNVAGFNSSLLNGIEEMTQVSGTFLLTVT
jgi:hypothetical protein